MSLPSFVLDGLFVFYMLEPSFSPPSSLSQLLTHPDSPLFISSRVETRRSRRHRRPGEIINRTQTGTI